MVIVPLQIDVPSLYHKYIACQHLDGNDKAPRFRTISSKFRFDYHF
ncbi:Uncharacterised protein [Streptococcus dysgalactiae subsp. dysgalactiae]|uniref:Uncharacterized protein n=1 Tax=Streptococcus dysgalactiae subsp. dysgalactiae TaxID=99822 RepID=A0A380JTJ1_STRDY|nr:Uncharacterised protein [Streptococcus dysgalactiae subsp. dysgalactiae]